jgi:Uma2 family endonuclease
MSTATLIEPAVTPADSYPAEPLEMETDEALYEMVHGQRVEMAHMGVRAAIVASRIGIAMGAYARPRRLGEAFTELLVHIPLPEDKSRDRRPDVSFFSHGRWPTTASGIPDVSALDLVPDLAIEVTSPSDRAEAQRQKVLEYFRAGVKYVWVVYPALRVVDVYDSPTAVRVFGPDDTLTASEILPGFELVIADLFTPPIS